MFVMSSNPAARHFSVVESWERITFLEIRIQVVEKLLHKYVDAASGQKNPGRSPTVDNPARLIERHFISHIPTTPAKREPARQNNVCCSKKDANGKRKHDASVMIAELVSPNSLDFKLKEGCFLPVIAFNLEFHPSTEYAL
ncbi:hypothetical protein TNCV_4252381 [Trichonephila clavipes]|nr:hypothetical protein TNCV_4252381 [Trichonephila clavipes]